MSNHSGLSRRKFIQNVGGGLIAVSAFPNIFSSTLWGQSTPKDRLNIALIGCGGRGRIILIEALDCRANLIALCDVEQTSIQTTKDHIINSRPALKSVAESVATYSDYRELLEKEKSLDAVIISIGPWWHAPMSTVFIKAGKHVFCEKPLTHNISESRKLGELARTSSVATQMGTQGVTSHAFRQSIDIGKSGVLGKVSEIHAWNIAHPLRPVSSARPDGSDPIPKELNWDMWLGPAQERPYKSKVYQPGCMTTAMWLDFGMGLIGDFGVHTWQLPIRAFDLGYPTRVEHNIPEEVKETYVSNAKIRFDFPNQITGWYYDTINRPPQNLVSELEATFGKLNIVGALTIGENGYMYSGGWGNECYLKLKGDEKFMGIAKHPAVQSIEKSEPRPTGGHMQEWVDAALSGKKSYQSFEVATRSMEIILPSIVSLRMQKPIDWDGEKMKVPGAPEADKFINENYRNKYLI